MRDDGSKSPSAKSPKSPSSSYTVHDAIESIGFGKFQIIMSVLAGFAWMADSMEIMLLSLLTPSLVCEWGITPPQQALSTTCVFVGWMICSPVWGWFCDRYGRRTGLFISALLCSIFGIATAASTSFLMFVILRGCVGLAIGGITQVATIYTEFLPTTKRATCIVALEFFWAIGAAVEGVIALIVMPTLGWRGLIVFSSLPLLMFAFCCAWMPESPRYYVAHGKNDKAFEVLQRVASYNKKELPEGKLVAEKTESMEKDLKKPTGILALIEKPLLVTSLLIWLVWMMNAFSYYGMTLYTTKLFQSTDTCHGGSEANIQLNDTSLCVPLKKEDYVDIIATSFSEVPGLILTFLLIERLGRKLTMSLQFLFFGIANYLLYFCMSRTWIVWILFFARALIAGAFQTAYVYTPEVYPTPMRALGIGTASAFGRMGAIVTPYVAQVVADHNLAYATLIYGSSGLLGSLASFLLPIETAGREMMDVSSTSSN
ncbi:hypothetical protein PFISCL1PPCAC_17446 [Pristionchus fissidentatus]|uniref:Major facilitator superfamily (MFS) profile domain-containing protein n=1 Tax=Pristionchus fissidentatus TaxID=1538716 RepID=A0AAV5W2J9_9BILA|nr:hypothetical protein PFISCL1PPCAC_17446 [Pristionchus fissidentatus]